MTCCSFFSVFQVVSYQRPNLSRVWSELMSVVCVCVSLSSSSAQPVLYWCSRNMSVWSNVSFNLAVLMNLLVCFFYPLEGVHGGQSHGDAARPPQGLLCGDAVRRHFRLLQKPGSDRGYALRTGRAAPADTSFFFFPFPPWQTATDTFYSLC